MFGIEYLKAPPTTYVLHYKSGKVKREGAGLSFLYHRPTSTVVMVPAATADVPFVFNEVTRDFQEVTIQGQLTYRAAHAARRRLTAACPSLRVRITYAHEASSRAAPPARLRRARGLEPRGPSGGSRAASGPQGADQPLAAR